MVVNGWKEKTNFSIQDAIYDFQAVGISEFLLTSVEKDGTLSGPDFSSLRHASAFPGIKIIASGGVSRLGRYLTSTYCWVFFNNIRQSTL